MIKLDEQINADMNALRSSMEVLHRFWVKSGALLDDFDTYSINVSNYFRIAYDPSEKTIGFYEKEGRNNDQLVCEHGEKGLSYFSYRMDDVGAIYGAIKDGNKIISVINDKVLSVSPEFGLQLKAKEISNVLTAINTTLQNEGIKRQSDLDNADFKHKEIFLSSVNTCANLQSNLSLKFDPISSFVQFNKSSPNGEKESMMRVYSSGHANFAEHLTTLQDKMIVAEACLNEMRTLNTELNESMSVTLEENNVNMRHHDIAKGRNM